MLLMELPPPHPLERIDSMAARTVEQKAAILFVGNIGNSLPGWGTRLYPKAALFYNDPGLDVVKHVSTSLVERQRVERAFSMRRYARLSNGVRRKLASHAAATALNCFSYNFIRIHRTLRTSPAMAAGVADRLWSVEDLAVLWETYEQRRAERAVA
jgi:hypothetical protein